MTAPVSRALYQCCLTAATVIKMMVVAVDGSMKWTRNVAPCSSLHLHVCHKILLYKIVLYLVSNCVKGDMELDVYSLQQKTLPQSDYGVELAMEGDV